MPTCPKCLEYNFKPPEESWNQAPDGLCLLHFRVEAKDENGAFTALIEEKKAHKDFKFSGVFFPKDIDFNRFEFSKKAFFNGVTFYGKAFFSGSIFFQSVVFTEANFYEKANFGEAKFHGDAFFLRLTFTKLPILAEGSSSRRQILMGYVL